MKPIENYIDRTGVTRTIGDMGTIIIPAAVREQLGIKSGDRFEFGIDAKGNIILMKV